MSASQPDRDRGPAGYTGTTQVRGRSSQPSRREYLRLLGPGLVSGAADTDPTTVATLVVVGATTTFGLAWLTLLTFPVLAVVQALATRVGFLGRRDLQQAVTDRYGRYLAGLLLVSILLVNLVTVAADLEAGAAALGLLTGLAWKWFVAPLALLLLGLLFINGYDEIERVLKYVMLCLLAYGVAAVLARPNWAAVASGSLVPRLRLNSDYTSGALAILGTTVTAYMYMWQTVEQVEQPAARPWLKTRVIDSSAGAFFATALFWFILISSAATLGVHHQHADTADQAAAALRPVAGRFASYLFAIGLLASALIAVPVIMASGAYATAAVFHWPRGLARKPRQAPRFYTTLTGIGLAGAALTLAGISPIRLLFAASVVAGIATPIGLVLLVLVAGNTQVMNNEPTDRRLLTAGWVIAALVTTLSLIYLAQQLHLLGG